MLTKDLLRFDRRNHKIIPRFLDVQNKPWQMLGQNLAELYQNGIGQSREELNETSQPLINGSRSPLIAKGLNKLLLDRCTFQEADDELETFRMQVFQISAKQFVQPGMNQLENYRQAMAQNMGVEDADTLSKSLHADLPMRQQLLNFKPLSPENLLHRYNMAQAQGPLFWSNGLEIEMIESDVGKRRQFFRYLKFFRLLATIHQHKTGHFRIQVDGPLNLFDNTRKYGLQLASFLPAVCPLNQWSIKAEVRIGKEEPVTLMLDHNMGLKSHFSQTSAYVPEEFEIFAKQFNKEGSDWKIRKNPTLLNLAHQGLVVPDFSYRHKEGLTVHLELFHRWHAGPLQSRLEHLSKNKKPPPLAIGVDRALAKESQEILEQSEWYQIHGFTFNKFPPVKRVINCLEGFLEKDC